MRQRGERPLVSLLAVAILLARLGPLHAGGRPLVPLPPPRPPAASAVPLPPPRPATADLPARPPTAVPQVSPPAAAAVPPLAAPSPVAPSATLPPSVPPPLSDVEIAEAVRVCAALFASRKIVARAVPPLSGPGGCVVPAPIELAAVVLSPTAQVAFKPPVEINCAMGDAFADWVRDDLVPVFAKAGHPLAVIADSSGYACRGRNRIVGAKLSEHGKGNAVDVGAFVSADGHRIGVQDKATDAAILTEVKRTACTRFSTVLGPGSDGFHEDHMHVDLEARRNRGRFCHWDLP